MREDWEVYTAPVRGASASWNGLIFPRVWELFVAALGDSAIFCYWLEDWSRGILCEELPCEDLAWDSRATVKNC